MKKTTFLFSAAFLFAVGSVGFAQAPKIQVIHNSADVNLQLIDVYDPLGNKIFDDAPSRTATPFISEGIPTGFPVTLSVAPGNSTSIDDAFYNFTITFEAGKTYIAVASGTRTDNGYTPFKPFAVSVNSNARDTALNPANTDILLFQGSTDLVPVNASEPGVGPIVNNVPYGVFLPYLEREATTYNFVLTNSETNQVIGDYTASFESLAGKAVTILGSGFYNPSANSNGAPFGLWMAVPEGGPLVEIPNSIASVAKNSLTGVSLYPNPAKSQVTINVPAGSTTVKSVIYDIMGRQVAAGNTNTLDVSGLTNGVYIVKADIDGKSFEQKIIKN